VKNLVQILLFSNATCTAYTEAAMREAVRSLPPADRRLFMWLYADADKYRKFLHSPCSGKEACPEFAVVFKDDNGDQSAGEYKTFLKTDQEKRKGEKEALLKLPGDEPWTKEELAEVGGCTAVRLSNSVECRAYPP
jgi:hypothetical protein